MSLVSAEKILETARGRKTRYEPKVQSCEPLCIFHDKTNKWCFYTLDPMLRVGWEWVQIYGTTTVTNWTQTPIKYWQLMLAPYFQAMGFFETIMDISKLIFVDFIADFAQFKMRVWGSLIWTQKGDICWGLGYDNEKMALTITLQHALVDCYKSIFTNICNPTAAWTGLDAKYLTKCTKSVPQVLNLREYIF